MALDKDIFNNTKTQIPSPCCYLGKKFGVFICISTNYTESKEFP